MRTTDKHGWTRMGIGARASARFNIPTEVCFPLIQEASCIATVKRTKVRAPMHWRLIRVHPCPSVVEN